MNEKKLVEEVLKVPRCPKCELPCVCSHMHHGTKKNPNPTCMCINKHLWQPNLIQKVREECEKENKHLKKRIAGLSSSLLRNKDICKSRYNTRSRITLMNDNQVLRVENRRLRRENNRIREDVDKISKKSHTELMNYGSVYGKLLVRVFLEKDWQDVLKVLKGGDEK